MLNSRLSRCHLVVPIKVCISIANVSFACSPKFEFDPWELPEWQCSNTSTRRMQTELYHDFFGSACQKVQVIRKYNTQSLLCEESVGIRLFARIQESEPRQSPTEPSQIFARAGAFARLHYGTCHLISGSKSRNTIEI
jgi:hypothetical protein